MFVTSDVELEANGLMIVVNPCTILVLQDVDGSVFVGQSKCGVPVKGIPSKIHVTDETWMHCLDLG